MRPIKEISREFICADSCWSADAYFRSLVRVSQFLQRLSGEGDCLISAHVYFAEKVFRFSEFWKLQKGIVSIKPDDAAMPIIKAVSIFQVHLRGRLALIRYTKILRHIHVIGCKRNLYRYSNLNNKIGELREDCFQKCRSIGLAWPNNFSSFRLRLTFLDAFHGR